MGGFLDASYGVAEERRGRLIKRVILGTLAVILIGTGLYFTFRTWRQERVIKQFLTLLSQKDYQGAYKLWGCSTETPCTFYPPEKFTQDWGPDGEYQSAAGASVKAVDVCGGGDGRGVVFDITFPKAQETGLWVDSKTNVISFAPWARCPGPHVRLGEFFSYLKARFTS